MSNMRFGSKTLSAFVVASVLALCAGSYGLGYHTGQLDYAVDVLKSRADVGDTSYSEPMRFDGGSPRDVDWVVAEALNWRAPSPARLAKLTVSGARVFLVADGAADGASDGAPVDAMSGDVIGIPDNVPKDDPVKLFEQIWSAFKDGKWSWAFGLIFAFLTLIFRKVYKPLSKGSKWAKATPWIAMGLSLVCALTFSLAAGGGWAAAIGAGVSAGVASIGSWELLLKKLIPEKQ
jgi:hypothetical protein